MMKSNLALLNCRPMENDKKSTFSQNLTRHKFSPSPANLTKNYDSAADG